SARADEVPGNPPLLGLSAEVSREVANDEMNVLMRVERQGEELAPINRDALARINALLAKAREVAGVESSLAGVGSNPIQAESRQADGTVESRVTGAHVHADASRQWLDIQALSMLIGGLGEVARVLSVGFSVSQETRSRVEAELLAEASKVFNEGAAAI